MKTMKKLLAWLLCVTLMLGMLGGLNLSVTAVVTVWDGSIADSFESGNGTEEDPYVIRTAEQLAYLSSSVSTGYTYEGEYLRLDDDIVLNDTTDWNQWGSYNEEGNLIVPIHKWEPIGGYVIRTNAHREFRGHFDGGNHTVSGLYYEDTNDGMLYYLDHVGGLFGFVYGADIRNLTVADSYLKGMKGDREEYTGGIVGYASDNFTISNCAFEGRIEGNEYVGGIVGYITSDCSVSDCRNTGSVSTNFLQGVSGYAGGIIGESYSNITVSGCSNSGTVSGESYSGGIVGYSLSDITISQCYNTGSVSAGTFNGGIAGSSSYNITISECYNAGTVDGAGISVNCLGENVRISDCYNTGAVLAGGVAGGRDFTVSNCYNTGTVRNTFPREDGGSSTSIYQWTNVTSLNCYYLDKSVGSEIKGWISLTDEQMRLKESFVGFNFNKTWEIISGDTDYPYPTLRCFGSKEFTYEITCLDGDEIVFRESVLQGSYTTLPVLENKEYLEFCGWLSGNERFKGGEIIYLSDDIQLFALWQVRNTSENVWDGTANTEWSGKGTKDEPYLIQTANDLAGLAETVNSGRSMYGVYFEQTADILLNDVYTEDENGGFSEYVIGHNKWTPIGNYDDEHYIVFGGDYNGKSFVVSGLYTTGEDHTGLFGYSSGSLHNITVEYSYVNGSGEYTGGIAGYGNTIEDCSFSGTVISSGEYSGGIAGYGRTIKDCSFSGSVTGIGRYVGGVVGSGATVESCTFSGKVESRGECTGGVAGSVVSVKNSASNGEINIEKKHFHHSIGGVVGNGYADGCINHADVNLFLGEYTYRGIGTGSSSGLDYAGGVVGRGSAEKCSNDGRIMCSGSNCTIGGITGNVSYEASVSDCINTGSVTGNCEYTGGIAGTVDGKSTLIRCQNSGQIDGSGFIGGIAGFIDGYVSTIKECCNSGVVESSGSVGGIICVLSGTPSVVSDCYNTGKLVAGDRAGGIVGYMGAGDVVENCYNIGAVSGKENYYGGIAGALGNQSATDEPDAKNLKSCYYLDDSVQNGNQYGTPLTAEQMKIKSSFENWNFNKTWEMNHDHSYQYPELKCFGSQDYRYEMTFYDGEKLLYSKLVRVGDEYLFTALKESQDLDFGYWRSSDNKRYYAGDTIVPRDDMILHAVWTTRNTSPSVWDGSVDTQWEGDGSYNNPYLISSASELAGLAEKANAGELKKYSVFKQTADITLNDGGEQFSEYVAGKNDWTPIGYDKLFSCHYQGNNYTISGLYVFSDGRAGLFGRTENSDIRAINIKDSYVQGSGSVGGVVATANNGTINDCSFTGTIIGISGSTGGVIGSSSGTVYSCVNNGTVIGLGALVNYRSKTGGVVGSADNNTVYSCNNSGKVIGNNGYIGGVLGESSYSVLNFCHNFGMVNGTNGYTGGIVGEAFDSALNNSENSGEVTGENYTGGIVGYESNTTARVCANSGTVNGQNRTGGISGYGDVAHCHNTGTVYGKTYTGGVTGDGDAANCNNIGAVNGQSDTGGIVGDGNATNCYNTGEVNGQSYTGGVTGDGNAEYCYNFGAVNGKIGIGGVSGYGDVSNCYNTGEVKGDNYTGGVVGYGSVKSSYNIGAVSCGGYSFGGVIADGESINSYFLESCVIDGNEYGKSLTETAMRDSEEYVGFDFETCWEIGIVDGYDYPTLKNVEHITTYIVTFMDNDGNILKKQSVPKGGRANPPTVSGYSDGEYYYSFYHWNGEYTDINSDVTIKAVYKQVAITKFNEISVPFTVENGFSKDNLRVQLESYLSRVLCTTTNDFKMMGEIVWSEDDLAAYDPQTAGEYLIHGILKITDPEYSAQSDYYAMADGAEVKAVITVQPTDEAPQEFVQDDLTYTVIDGQHAMITGYTGNAAEIMLPSKLGGFTVTQISEGAFAQNEALTSVTIPSSVVSVGKDAFADCISLLMVTLEEGVEIIGDGAFRNTSLICATLPRSIEFIGKQAFGYYSEDEAIQGFAFYCYQDTVGVQYAKENSFECFTVNGQTDEESGISAVVEDDLTLVVSPVADGAYYETAQQIVQENDDVSLFNIKTVDSQAQEVQPGNILTVSIPVPTGFDAALCKVYRVNSDGSVMNMNARVVGEKLVFNTAHLSYYAVVEDVVAPPVAKKVTPLTVLLEAKDGYEYRISGGNWQSDPLFDGLEPETEYTFYSRIAAKDGTPSSVESAGIIIKTAESEHHKLSGYINKNSGRLGEVIFELSREGKEPIILSSWSKVYSFDSLESGHYFMRITSELGEEAAAIVDIDDEDVTIDIHIERIPGSENLFILGDVSGDGSVMITDATFVQRYIVGIETPFTKRQLMHADIDRSGELEIMDVTAIQYYLASMKTGYEIGWLV